MTIVSTRLRIAALAVASASLCALLAEAGPDEAEAAPRTVLDHWRTLGRVQLGFETPVDKIYPIFPWEWTAIDPTAPDRRNPHYVTGRRVVDNEDKRAAHGGRQHFRIEANGGPALYRFSASRGQNLLPLDLDFSYRIAAWIRTDNLALDGLRASRPDILVAYVDAHGRMLAHEVLAPDPDDLAPQGQWLRLTRELSPPEADNLAGMILYIRLNGLSLDGSVGFDDIHVTRFPRVGVQPHAAGDPTKRLVRLFVDGEQRPMVTADLSGLQHDRYASRLTLLNHEGKVVATDEKTVTPHPQSPVALGLPEDDAGDIRSYRDKHEWALPFEAYGLYRLRHELTYGDQRLEDERTVAFLHRLGSSQGGEVAFGARLLEAPSDPIRAAAALRKLGVTWVKLPIWRAGTTPETIERGANPVRRLLEAIRLDGIRSVGVLAEAPEVVLDARRQGGVRERTVEPVEGMLDVFAGPEMSWAPLLRATFTRYGDRIEHWQLGPDDDISFRGGGLLVMERQIRRALGRIGFRKRLGIPVHLLFADPELLARGSDFVSMAEGRDVMPELLPEIGADLGRLEAPTWLTMDLLSRSRYGEAEHLRDMVLRLAHATRRGWDAVFIGRLAHDETGLLDGGLNPTRSYLAARTLIDELAGFRLIGAERIQRGVTGYFFAGPHGRIKLVAWGDAKAPLEVFLGHEIVITDLDGNRATWQAKTADGPPRVSTEPRIYSGINHDLMQTRLSFGVTPDTIISTAVRQRAEVTFTNHFKQPMQGYMQLMFPEGWHVSTPRLRFSLVGGETYRVPIDLVVPGTQPEGPFDLKARVAMTVTMEGNRHQEFDVYFTRRLQVKPRDVDVNILVEQDEDNANVFLFYLEILNTSERNVRMTATMAAHGILPDERVLPVLRPGKRIQKRFRFVRTDPANQTRVRFVIRDTLGEHFVNRYIQLGEDSFFEL